MSESKLGWAFTEAEDRAIEKAIEKSKKYMEGYGKGRKPMMIDKRHYENRLPERPKHNKPEKEER